VKEFKNTGPADAQVVFNRHHSKLRNVIERTFGTAKAKWQMLKGVPHYWEPKNIDNSCSVCTAQLRA
jgi:hypothetical protein